MSNMSYCRFENTAQDLRDCLNHMDETDDLNEYETRGRTSIIKMAVEIALDYGMDIGREVEEVDQAGT